ncbi:hypothetical protein [Dryocola sp. BD613]|uniref:hypothetical protein n=1 Tax=Dryocola sp. BD613 TaxID=3133272 RepID=UPI003F4FF65C
MDIDKYKDFSAYLKLLVKDERERFVVDKNVILTASAVIDELLIKVSAANAALSTDKTVKESLRTA